MEDLKAILKKPAVLIGLEIVGVLVVAALIVWFIIIPKYKSWRSLSSENKQSQEQVAEADRSIASVRGIDVSEVEDWQQKLAPLLLATVDPIRFFSLAEKIAAASGMKVSAAQVESSTVTSGAVSGSANTPSVSSGSSGANGIVPRTASQIRSVTIVKMSFEGSFPALLSLLDNFDKGDQAVQVSSVSLSGDQTGGGLTVSVSFLLPTAAGTSLASMGSVATLTSADKKALEDLVAKIQFTTAPTNSPVGREDPFK